MVRRLLIVLFAVVAIAWPATAAPLAPAVPAVPDPATLDAICLDTCSAAFVYSSPVGAALSPAVATLQCEFIGWDMPSSDIPVTDLVRVDPDGCLRAFLHRTLGWPPLLTHVEEQVAVQATTVLPPALAEPFASPP
jgi:hypothetical protein